MNGIAERTWQSVRELAFSMMTHAQVGDEFYDYALQHAWKGIQLSSCEKS